MLQMIRIYSDLHLEFGTNIIKKCVNISSSNRTKYTVLAGDITNFKKREDILTQFVTEIKPHTDHIIYILGNHEYYEPDNLNVSEIKREYKILCNKLGITLLEDSSLETDDFVFYGATIWSKPDIGTFLKMNDRYSFKNHQEVIDIHEESAYQLSRFLAEYKITDKPLVVITHHLPSFTLIDKEYRRYKDFNSGFASKLDNLIKEPINYWIYGHTHKPNNTIINGVNLICNPHGYPGPECINFKDCTI